MVRVSARIVSNQVSPSLRRVSNSLAKVPNQALQVFKDNTPVDKGNARRKTKLRGEKIVADYDYAKRLDEGSSKKAPEGMTKPTIDFVKKRLDQIFKRG